MLKRTKGFVSLVAAIALMLGLCSCSGKPETDPSTTADPTGIGAQAETGENTTAKDIAPESGAPETAAEEAGTAEKASTAAPTEKTTKGKNNHVKCQRRRIHLARARLYTAFLSVQHSV